MVVVSVCLFGIYTAYLNDTVNSHVLWWQLLAEATLKKSSAANQLFQGQTEAQEFPQPHSIFKTNQWIPGKVLEGAMLKTLL